MVRHKLFEWEDLAWLPDFIRGGATDALRFAMEATGACRALVPILVTCIESTAATAIIDLGSGSGGPMIWLFRRLRPQIGWPLTLVLTDRYPNPAALMAWATPEQPWIQAHLAPTLATEVPEDLSGLRTLCNVLHHLSLSEVRQTFQQARHQQQPIFVVELVGRSWRSLLLVVAATLFSFVSPWVTRSGDWRRWPFTYLVPVIPFVVFWDGCVSCLRSYSEAELVQLTDELSTPHYGFRTFRVPTLGGLFGLQCVVGSPVQQPANADVVADPARACITSG